MSTDETPDGDRGDESAEDESHTTPLDGDDELVEADVRERLEEGADKAVDQFDEGLIDLLAWMLETETRARIYVQLRKEPDQTSDEIAEGTGLYPSTVREALASLHDDEIVTRQKRQNSGAGNNPFEYSAIPPSELVGEVVEEVQSHLNKVFNLDAYMDRSESASPEENEPVTITVTDESERRANETGSEDDPPTETDSSEETTNSESDGDDSEDEGTV